MYLRGNIFGPLRGDIIIPDFMSGAQPLDEELSGIWIGSKGCVTPLHFDPWCVLHSFSVAGIPPRREPLLPVCTSTVLSA